jgi:hypothetical protein
MKGERDTLPAIPHIRIAITCRIVDGLHNLSYLVQRQLRPNSNVPSTGTCARSVDWP